MQDLSDLEAQAAQIRSQSPETLASVRTLAVYGAGFLGDWTVAWLIAQGITPIACIDGDSRKHGHRLHGVDIVGPDALDRLKPDLTLITARHAVGPVAKQLGDAGLESVSLDAWYVAQHFEDFRTAFEQLQDAASRQTLVAVLASMLSGRRAPLLSVWEQNQYFCLPQFCGIERETYVDAGAYVGDSIERFIWANAGVFSKIHAFEPASRQFTALQTRCERLTREWALDAAQIALNQAGLSSGTSRMSGATASGLLQSMSLAEAPDGTISTVSLDAYLDGARVTTIKADVEGMEMALLTGAATTIRTHRPKLAICVYHYPPDIPQIMSFLRTLVPDYRFSLRHHSPQLMETVLYAWTD